jgi:radical SAM superfamily enzyme YgiQ (UPF0313 family)
MNVVLVALYRYQNYPVRILHSLLEGLGGITPHAVFFKNGYTNAVKPPTAREEALFAERIRALSPALVGFSVYSPYVSAARRLTAIVRRNSSARVVWGGIHPTIFPELSIPEADAVCVGEGEAALVELTAALRDGKDYRSIPNLWVKDSGGVVRNPMRPLIQDLDALPFPGVSRNTFDFIDHDQLSTPDPALRDPTLSVLPARGCPFACTYCVNSLLRPLYRGLGPFLRRRSVANVIREIREVLSLPGSQGKTVEFHDENFGTDAAWLAEFEALYPREIGLPFKVQYNPNLVKPETIRRLRQAGLHRVKFGIETGTDRVRNQVFGRPGRNRDIIGLMREIAETGVKVRYDLILDNPYDTEESLTETLRLFLDLPKPLRCNLYSLQFFPGYPLTARALADRHIDAAEASLDTLEERMSRNWAFVPKLLPFNRRQQLQNMIWLYTSGGVADDDLRHAIAGGGFASRLHLVLLNLKAVFLGKVQALRRRMRRVEY